jgi:hypothetical protein
MTKSRDERRASRAIKALKLKSLRRLKTCRFYHNAECPAGNGVACKAVRRTMLVGTRSAKETAKDRQRFPEKELSREVERRGLGMDAVPLALRGGC